MPHTSKGYKPAFYEVQLTDRVVVQPERYLPSTHMMWISGWCTWLPSPASVLFAIAHFLSRLSTRAPTDFQENKNWAIKWDYCFKREPWRKQPQQFRPPRNINKFKELWGSLQVTSLEKLYNRLLELQGHIKIMAL